MRSILVFAGAAALVAAGLSGCSSASGSTAAKDVSLSSCSAGATGGHPVAGGKILNHSSKASIYTIHVKFLDSSGNSVADGVAAVAKVDPGTTAAWHADGSLDAKGPLRCTLSVTRNIAP